MKTNAAFAKSLLVVASFGLVLPMLAKPPAKPAPAAAKQEEAAKAEGDDAEATIPGVSVARKNGDFIGIEIADGGFKLSFYDKKKKQIDCDVARATARWNPKYKKGDERAVLNPSGDGKTLTSPNIRPPYNFKLYLTLLSSDDQAVETFVVDFRG